MLSKNLFLYICFLLGWNCYCWGAENSSCLESLNSDNLHLCSLPSVGVEAVSQSLGNSQALTAKKKNNTAEKKDVTESDIRETYKLQQITVSQEMIEKIIVLNKKYGTYHTTLESLFKEHPNEDPYQRYQRYQKSRKSQTDASERRNDLNVLSTVPIKIDINNNLIHQNYSSLNQQEQSILNIEAVQYPDLNTSVQSSITAGAFFNALLFSKDLFVNENSDGESSVEIDSSAVDELTNNSEESTNNSEANQQKSFEKTDINFNITTSSNINNTDESATESQNSNEIIHNSHGGTGCSAKFTERPSSSHVQHKDSYTIVMKKWQYYFIVFYLSATSLYFIFTSVSLYNNQTNTHHFLSNYVYYDCGTYLINKIIEIRIKMLDIATQKLMIVRDIIQTYRSKS